MRFLIPKESVWSLREEPDGAAGADLSRSGTSFAMLQTEVRANPFTFETIHDRRATSNDLATEDMR